MSKDLAAREPALEWAHRAAKQELEGLGWVDTNLDPKAPALSQREDESTDEERRFLHFPYTAFMPNVLANAAIEAKAHGEAPMVEAVVLLLARPEWLIAGRHLMWSPLSPVPRILSTLVEAFGVDQDLHRNDPEILARLAAQLPGWHAHRGTVSRAREVLESTGDLAQADGTATVATDGEVPTSPDLREEVFACRDETWWAARSKGEPEPEYRISGGVLKFQPKSGNAYVLRREDVLVEWQAGRPVPRQLMRLLPSWVVVRLVIPAESST